jgi:hypothetical protein
MWFVFSEQPWYVGRENLLIELVRPDARSNPLESYRFESLYVTAKIYGIPYSLRTEDLAKRIIGTFGEPSNLQPLTKDMLLGQRETESTLELRPRLTSEREWWTASSCGSPPRAPPSQPTSTTARFRRSAHFAVSCFMKLQNVLSGDRSS